MADDLGFEAIRRMRTKDDAIEYALRVFRYLQTKKALSEKEMGPWNERGTLFDKIVKDRGIAPRDY